MSCKKNIMLVVLMVAVTFFQVPAQAGAIDPFSGLSGEIRISGGTAHIPVMKEAAKQIMRANPEISISIAGGGSGVGIKQVGEGIVDIGNSGRAATDAEVEKYGLKLFKWAIDGVGAAVNPGNPVTSLTKAQLKDIYSGKITNWKDLGGKDAPITVYTRDESSGTRAVFWKKALDKGDIVSSANFVVSNGAMKTAIANDPNAIGYVSVGHMDASVAGVALDGVPPTIDTVKSGEYKVARGLYSNTQGDPSGLTKLFIAYLLSPEGQRIVVQKGFVPVN
ncbi:phosphate ABC transporter substrate-binding protein [Desulfotignum phosphitoxidans]|uniref:Phosphate-binding protein n=1 Tax=Desulfotignum phosphitoxidans DSM 13687 TaxID=1286635 RepID=S0G7R3_9BACT|nr:phosphate ABC transporter substrate-binding protein [Desulfotignum phosphitoxidans]EMS81392.1 phosphate-binding protein PstS [Desulfotignum phosphitoxidans DSM 13687]